MAAGVTLFEAEGKPARMHMFEGSPSLWSVAGVSNDVKSSETCIKAVNLRFSRAFFRRNDIVINGLGKLT